MISLRARIEARLARVYAVLKHDDGPVPIGLLVDLYEKTITDYVHELVEKPFRKHVLDRASLIDRWSLLDCKNEGQHRDVIYSIALLGTAEYSAGLAPKDPFWPTNVAPTDVAEAIERSDPKMSAPLVEALRNGWFYPNGPQRQFGARDEAYTIELPGARSVSEELGRAMQRWPIRIAALIVSVEKALQEDRRRAHIAIDASHAHNGLLTGMRDLPKDAMRKRGAPSTMPVHDVGTSDQRCEIITPNGGPIQLVLPFNGTLGEALVETIRKWKGYDGLRHWAVLLRLFSIEGGRTGRVRWSLESHLGALDYSASVRRDPEVRRRVAAEVELFTKLELAIYWPNGKLRSRLPLVIPIEKTDAETDGTWSLEGMTLSMNQFLFRGVRDQETGELGADWFPAPLELAKIDHTRSPYALALGLILPIRWRWDWKDGRECTRFTGAKLLATAGIEYTPGRAKRSWDKARGALDELIRIEELGRYEWVGEPWTLQGKIDLFPAQWMRDRTWGELAPVEKVAVTPPQTGAELVAWRKARGLSQEAFAKELGVSERTIRNAERPHVAKMPPSVAKALGSRG